jgi:hypothetical protein
MTDKVVVGLEPLIQIDHVVQFERLGFEALGDLLQRISRATILLFDAPEAIDQEDKWAKKEDHVIAQEFGKA